MTAIRFPDISSRQAGIPLTGAPAVIVKATEGTGYTNPDFAPAEGRAASAGAFFIGYHFLRAGNAAAQAAHCHAITGNDVPLMLDFESTGSSKPKMADAEAFIDEYRKLGGTCYLAYLPEWYWKQIGSPSMTPLLYRRMRLVSSHYTTYSDNGPGWNPYGGVVPDIWQYTSSGTFNAWHPIDLNAFKGTVAELRSLATTGHRTPPPPPTPTPDHPVWPAGVILKLGDHGDAVTVLQQALHDSGQYGARGLEPIDGIFGPVTEMAVRNFQHDVHLTVDGIAGPQTRAALGVK